MGVLDALLKWIGAAPEDQPEDVLEGAAEEERWREQEVEEYGDQPKGDRP